MRDRHIIATGQYQKISPEHSTGDVKFDLERSNPGQTFERCMTNYIQLKRLFQEDKEF